MYCTKCGVELRDQDAYCSRCGARAAAWALAEEPAPVYDAPRALMLDKRHKKIAGVCAGFARYFGMDLVLMRVLWLVIAFSTGVGFLVYIAAWIALPSDYGYEPPPSLPYAPVRR
jgi:phage shock protein C